MNKNMSNDCSKNISNDVRINIPKDNITYENIKQESLLVKLLKKLNIL